MVHGVETGLSGQETADVDESLGVEITAAAQINTDVGDALGASAGCGTPEEEKVAPPEEGSVDAKSAEAGGIGEGGPEEIARGASQEGIAAQGVGGSGRSEEASRTVAEAGDAPSDAGLLGGIAGKDYAVQQGGIGI